MKVIDTHLHLWRRSPGQYGWLTPELGAIYDDFDASQARSELVTAGVDAAILVQADDSEADTEFMLAVARDNPWVLGVVGWIPLDDSRRAESTLAKWLESGLLSSVRQLVHDDPRDDFYCLHEVRRTAQLLAAAEIPLDIPDAWPRDLPQIVELAREVPTLTIVIDHLGKPPVDDAEISAWMSTMTLLAEQPHVYVKFSGLHHPQRAFTVDGVRALWESSLELFGPERMMLGSDWPISLPYGGYQPTWATIDALRAELSPGEQVSVASETAQRVYQSSVRVKEFTT